MTDYQPVPSVSVIIPTYNRAHLVSRAIRSVLGQTYQDFEIIVVDDASVDGTEEVVKSFDDPRISYIRHEQNQGGSAARNTGIRAARGEYIAFLDSDDEWLAEKLKRQIVCLRGDPVRVGAVYTGRIYVMEGQVVKTVRPTLGGDLRSALLAGNIVGTTSSVVVRRTYLEQAGLFDETLPAAQDADLWIRLSDICLFGVISDPLVRFHVDAAERITHNLEARLKAWRILDEKHSSRYSRVSFRRRRGARPAKAGYLHYLSGDRRMGLRYLVEGLLIWPFSPRTWLYLGVALCPRTLYLFLRRWIRPFDPRGEMPKERFE